MRCFSRYRLKTLLAFVGVWSVALSWYVYQSRQRTIETKAIAELNEQLEFGRIDVLRDDEPSFCGNGLYGQVRVRSSAPEWVQAIMDFVGSDILLRVDEIELWGEDFDRQCLEPISRFKSLRALSIARTQLTRSDIDRLLEATPNIKLSYSELQEEPEIDIDLLPPEYRENPGGFF